MKKALARPLIITAGALLITLGGCTTTAPIAQQAMADSSAERSLTAYLEAQKTTGFLIMRNDRVVYERYFPTPKDAAYVPFVYESARSGGVLEDVASQQKSLVGVLVAIAEDKGLIDIERPVSAYLGTGWSRAAADHEAKIRVVDVLTMTSGLDEKFGFVAPAGTRFFYNTPVYAVTKRILIAVAKQPLDALTREWLTGPAEMAETAWRERPAALAGVGNSTGLVTSVHDVATLGRMVLEEGIAPNGRRVVSRRALADLLTPSPINPAYARLWWRNSRIGTTATGLVFDGGMVPSAPSDMVMALGALDRKLYLVPSTGVVVVRFGGQAPDDHFDQQVWRLIEPLLSRDQ